MRRISLALLSLLTLATLASACGLATNTLAQDLAWERWEKCNRFRGITLKEIKTDGHIWVWVADGGEQTAWRECERQAAREQGARRPASPTSPSPLTAATAALGPIPLPVWKVGSEWAYRYEQPSGTGTFVWSVDRVVMVGGQPHYVIKSGTREIFYRVSDLAFTQETVNSTLVRQATPSDWRWVAFPLTSGKSWEMQYLEERPADRQTKDVRRACTAASAS
jgi:hypothetical protein